MTRSRFLARAATVAAVAGGSALVPLTALTASASAASPKYVSDPSSLVNPFIGTTNGGDTFPGADLPFGMIQLGPVTPSHPSGGNYSYNDTTIDGYSLNDMSGPGCAAEGDVPILPTSGAVPASPADASSPLDHSQESASPGYYQLTSGGVETQLATTMRAGAERFTFPTGSAGNLLFKLSGSSTPDSATHFQVVSDKEVQGYVTTGDFCGANNQYTLHFDMTFNRPIASYGTWTNGQTQANDKAMTTHLTAAQQAQARQAAKLAGQQALADKGLPGTRNSANGKLRAGTSTAPAATPKALAPPVTGADGAYVSFNPANGVVQAKVGISYVSTANAASNLAAEVPASSSFASVKRSATTAWNQALGKIQIAGGTTDQQTPCYTGL